uniref:Trafficking protein particle complex subunit n=1 Tax=Paramoeba aestuarina TaxID=180227 RepID=A0A7S4P1M2_9EUKA
MEVFNLFIFNRRGDCLFYQQWDRTNAPLSLAEEQKLMFGLIYSLKSFVSKSSPQTGDTFKYYKTSTYKLHFFESLTGIKFILLTEPGAGDLSATLKEIYNNYVRFCTKNPLYKIGDPIKCDLFSQSLQAQIQKLKSGK